MGRKLRPYLPGGFFHIITRLQDHFRYFDDELSERSIEIIGEAEAQSDARIYAQAIMPTHLHLVVQQGCRPLSRLMQPMLRRIAHQVKRRHKTEGHAMERSYRALACASVEHLRDAIVYVHLNPVRSNICANPDDYPWTSHAEYMGKRVSYAVPGADTVLDGLSFFAETETGDVLQLRRDYESYVRWRLASDNWSASWEAGLPVTACPECPSVAAGDARWLEVMAKCNSAASTTSRPRPDLRDVIVRQLATILPEANIEMLRQGWQSRLLIGIRNQLIWSALLAGYSGVEIARFLNVSDSTVSRVSRAGPPVRRAAS